MAGPLFYRSQSHSAATRELVPDFPGGFDLPGGEGFEPRKKCPLPFLASTRHVAPPPPPSSQPRGNWSPIRRGGGSIRMGGGVRVPAQGDARGGDVLEPHRAAGQTGR